MTRRGIILMTVMMLTSATYAAGASAVNTLRSARIDSLLMSLDPDSVDMPEWVTERYFDVLRAHDDDPEGALPRRYLARALPLMPDSVQAQIASETHQRDIDRWIFEPGAGEAMIRWWRSRDPLPGTERNELVEEHVMRMARSLREFGAETATGYDDRGVVHVRLGEPDIARDIDIAKSDALRDIFRFGVPVTLSDFPDTEVWVYRRIHPDVYFIFVADRQEYRIGGLHDMIPRPLRRTMAGTERNANIAVSTLAAVRFFLERLSLLNVNFGPQYSAVDSYAMWQEEQRFASDVGSPGLTGSVETVVGSGFTSVRVYANPMFGIQPIHHVATQTLSEARTNDYYAARTREELAPQLATDTFERLDQEELPLGVRISRFLNDDGSTRAYIDWSPQLGGLHLSDRRRQSLEETGHDLYRDVVLDAAAIGYNDAYRKVNLGEQTIAMAGPPTEETHMLPQTFTVDSLSAAHIALQVDQHVAFFREGPPVRVLRGRRMKIGVHDPEPVVPLNDDRRRLEMSDIRPFFNPLPVEAVAALDDPLDGAHPFPYRFVPAVGSLILTFDIYHLLLGADDMARYDIEYEVARRTRQGGLAGFIGRTRQDRTSARTRHEHPARNVGEMIVLDPAEWIDEPEIVVVVRITDQVGRATIERELRFGR